MATSTYAGMRAAMKKEGAEMTPEAAPQGGGVRQSRTSSVTSEDRAKGALLSELADAVSEAQALTEEVRGAATPLSRCKEEVEAAQQAKRQKGSKGDLARKSSDGSSPEALEELRQRVERALHTRESLERDVAALTDRWNEKLKQVEEVAVAAKKDSAISPRRPFSRQATVHEHGKSPVNDGGGAQEDGSDNAKPRSATDWAIGGIVALAAAHAVGIVLSVPVQAATRKSKKEQRQQQPSVSKTSSKEDEAAVVNGNQVDFVATAVADARRCVTATTDLMSNAMSGAKTVAGNVADGVKSMAGSTGHAVSNAKSIAGNVSDGVKSMAGRTGDAVANRRREMATWIDLEALRSQIISDHPRVYGAPKKLKEEEEPKKRAKKEGSATEQTEEAEDGVLAKAAIGAHHAVLHIFGGAARGAASLLRFLGKATNVGAGAVAVQLRRAKGAEPGV